MSGRRVETRRISEGDAEWRLRLALCSLANAPGFHGGGENANFR
jgi:hypothetical protein